MKVELNFTMHHHIHLTSICIWYDAMVQMGYLYIFISVGNSKISKHKKVYKFRNISLTARKSHFSYCIRKLVVLLQVPIMKSWKDFQSLQWTLLRNCYFLHWNFDWKSCVVVFFHEWNEWKNPQFNFSSQDLSIERNFFKWDGKVTKISHLLFHRIWKITIPTGEFFQFEEIYDITILSIALKFILFLVLFVWNMTTMIVVWLQQQWAG